MLKRILASLAVTSLLIAAVVLVYWWRSNHGHVDSFNMGTIGSPQSTFISQNGRIALEVTDHLGSSIMTRMEFYQFKNVLGALLLVPALWVAIKIRSYLPRPPGRELAATPRRGRLR